MSIHDDDTFRIATRPRELAEADVPAWCVVVSLGGQCPVQAEGTCEGSRWYFRARLGEWSIGVAQGAEDPFDLDVDRPGAFFHEEDYGDDGHSAGYMSAGQARYFIVRELSRFRASQGRRDCGP